MSRKNTRPRQPKKPKPPRIFDYKDVILREQNPSGWSGSELGSVSGPITLGGLLDLLPDDVDLDEVFIDPTTEYESPHCGIVVRKAILLHSAEERLVTYRAKMAEWEEEMKAHKIEMRKWIAASTERLRKKRVEDRRKELEDIEMRQKELLSQQREDEKVSYREGPQG